MHRVQDEDSRRVTPPEAEDFTQRFWPWFALGVLMFCWIAEATLCAVRGF
jgi:hypothetical protein